MRQAAPIATPNIGFPDIMATVKDAEADALDVQFRFAQGDIKYKGFVSESLCFAQDIRSTVA